MVQRKFCDEFFDSPTYDNPGLCPVIHHGINFDFNPVTVNVFCHAHIQHETKFDVALNKPFSSRRSTLITSRVSVLSTRTCFAITFQINVGIVTNSCPLMTFLVNPASARAFVKRRSSGDTRIFHRVAATSLPVLLNPRRKTLATALALGWSRKVSLCFRTFRHNALAACGPKQAV